MWRSAMSEVELDRLDSGRLPAERTGDRYVACVTV